MTTQAHHIDWLVALGYPKPEQLIRLTGDAGQRAYWRVVYPTHRYILMDAPGHSLASYLQVWQDCQRVGIPVPAIYASHATGRLLQQDVGDQFLSQVPKDQGAYQQAMNQLSHFQLQRLVLPTYTYTMLYQECQLLADWWADRLLGFPFSAAEQHSFDRISRCLAGQAMTQPKVPVHRDYHSRNLLWHNQQSIWLDFQDACLGPLLYDVVSLLDDVYVTLPADLRESLLYTHYQHSQSAGWLAGVSWSCYQQWAAWLSLQRHIKVLGIFSRLAIRDQKPDYLARYQQRLMTVLTEACQQSALTDELWSLLQPRFACALAC